MDDRDEERLLAGLEETVRILADRYAMQSREPIEDIRQEGRIGALMAIRGYDSRRGTKLRSYAWRRIQSRIQHYLRDHTGLIRVSGYAQDAHIPTPTTCLFCEAPVNAETGEPIVDEIPDIQSEVALRDVDSNGEARRAAARRAEAEERLLSVLRSHLTPKQYQVVVGTVIEDRCIWDYGRSIGQSGHSYKLRDRAFEKVRLLFEDGTLPAGSPSP